MRNPSSITDVKEESHFTGMTRNVVRTISYQSSPELLKLRLRVHMHGENMTRMSKGLA